MAMIARRLPAASPTDWRSEFTAARTFLRGPPRPNFPAAEARADRLSTLHVDDMRLPGRCSAVRRWLLQRSGAVMYVHAVYFIDERGAKVGTWRCPVPRSGALVPAEPLLWRLRVQNFLPIPGPTIRRDVFLTVGGMDDSLWYIDIDTALAA